MLLLDENISEIEVWRLRERGIAVRQIGPDLAAPSIGDDNILPLLHRLKRPTFFTRDRDFWRRELAHPRYCLAFMDIPEHEGQIAEAIRRFLRHPRFDAHAKRMGKVVRVHFGGVDFYQHGGRILERAGWLEK
jgi:hypothetical protein